MKTIPKHAPTIDVTASSKMKMPHTKETNTIKLEPRPRVTANPAFLIPYIVAVPAGTQNMPDTIPHGVNEKGRPINKTTQLVRKPMNVL
mmetsp:Transcript_680/g.1033  ORF Transcript_680/g.1033 Transcript_680/m.1033 type:complete len:89 (-) Transcript_680:203-469(-)